MSAAPHDMWEFGVSPREITKGKNRAIKQAKATIGATVDRGTTTLGHPSMSQRKFLAAIELIQKTWLTLGIIKA
jgi:hypothetical protein